MWSRNIPDEPQSQTHERNRGLFLFLTLSFGGGGGGGGVLQEEITNVQFVLNLKERDSRQSHQREMKQPMPRRRDG